MSFLIFAGYIKIALAGFVANKNTHVSGRVSLWEYGGFIKSLIKYTYHMNQNFDQFYLLECTCAVAADM